MSFIYARFILATFVITASVQSKAQSCAASFSKHQTEQNSRITEMILKTFGLPADLVGMRVSGSISNPPRDPSIAGNDVLIRILENRKISIEVRTRDYVANDLVIDGQILIPRAGWSKAIEITNHDTFRGSSDDFIVTTSNGSLVRIVSTRLDGRFAGSTMILVTISTTDGSALSAYVMAESEIKTEPIRR